jgi:hypothetical protein
MLSCCAVQGSFEHEVHGGVRSDAYTNHLHAGGHSHGLLKGIGALESTTAADQMCRGCGLCVAVLLVLITACSNAETPQWKSCSGTGGVLVR